MREGFARSIWSDGSYQEGFWKQGLREGLGKYTLSCGDIYIGQWKNDKKFGKG